MIPRNILVRQIGKAAVIGTAIVFFTNIFCHGAGVLISADRQKTDIAMIITIILGIFAVIDVAAGFVLKKKLLAPLFDPDNPPTEELLAQTILKTAIVISVLCAAPPIYGLVIVFLGGATEIMVGFSIISLGGFLVMRLRPRDFNMILREY